MLYQLSDATISVGGEEILSHVNFEIRGTEKIAVVGRNGAGKSTLLRVLSGELPVERDDRRKQAAVHMARKISVDMLSQQVFLNGKRTVKEELLAAYHERDTAYAAEQELFGVNEKDYERERFLYECEYDRLLTGFGFSKEDKNRRISEFSGGQQTKLALIRLLLAKPDILLLDEPTNHLDMETTEWLEEYLRTYPKAVVMVSHDRFFLDRVAQVVYEVTDRSLKRYAGNYTAYRQEKVRTTLRLQKQYEQQMAERARLEELIERFKNKPRKAAMARAKKKQLERMAVPERVMCERQIHFDAPITPLVQGAKWVYEAEHLHVGYDQPLYETSLRIRRGQKIAVLGVNGSGKTALLKTVAGLLPPIKGKSTLGNQILMGYFDQQSGALSSEKTVLEHFHELFPALTEKEARQLLAAWLFDGRMAARPVDVLSGGEKARLVMAELLQSGPNFCVLDEPTNHMDIQAKEVLEEAFSAYAGAMLFVSHDRYFVSRVADALLIIQGGEVYYYPFGYEHYLEHSRQQDTDLPPAGQMKAEDAALLARVKAVPKRGHLMGREQSTEEAYLDWKLRLLDEELEEVWTQFEAHMQKLPAPSAWMQAEEELTERLIAWDLRYQELVK